MNPAMKQAMAASMMIGVAIVIAVTAYAYMGPFQTCLRSVQTDRPSMSESSVTRYCLTQMGASTSCPDCSCPDCNCY